MSINKIHEVIETCLKKCPCLVDVRYSESMKEHTTFKVGGPADCWVCPKGEVFAAFCSELIKAAKIENIPVFVLGGGANIVVSDKGIRGIVLDMGQWSSEGACFLDQDDCGIAFKSGTGIDQAVEIAASAGLSGLEFLAGMPGTIGGAVWMNARCYDREISDFLTWVEIIDCDYEIKRITIDKSLKETEFGYKISPFQKMEALILNAAFNLEKGNRENIKIEIDKNRQDRVNKGHYLFPCAGSAFKNNRKFGKPTGALVDELGMKGLKRGNARIAPFHGNIIINTGSAKAADIRALTDEVAARVKTATGFILEPEILFVGDWQEESLTL